MSMNCLSQNISGQQLLDSAIAYHDPQGHWKSFNDTLFVTMEMPERPKRYSKITLNFPKVYFNLVAKQDTITTTYILKQGKCIITKQDSLIIAKQTTKPKRSHCETAELYKNYYSYLYGLPMKLKDTGTIISNNVEKKRFKGKDYLTLKVTYESNIGNDIWYFYFNPSTYAMEVYQFFKSDDNGNLIPNSGEYIILNDEKIVSGIKMPKNRAWYYNKNDSYLGTDILE